MRLSLITILERLELSDKSVSTNIKNHHFYKSVRIKGKDETAILPECIYLADTVSANDLSIPDTSCMFYCCPCCLPDTIECCSTRVPHPIHNILNRILTIFEYYNAYEDEILDVLRWRGTLQEMINILSRMFGNPTYLIDSSFKVLAIDESPHLSEVSITWKRMLERRYMFVDTVSSLMDNTLWKELETTFVPTIITPKPSENIWPEFYIPFINCNIWINQKICAHFFVVAVHQPVTQGTLDLASGFLKYLEEGILANSENSLSVEHHYEHFLYDVFSGNLIDKELIQEQLKPLGWDIYDTFCILTINISNQTDSYVRFLSKRLENLEGLYFLYKKQLYCIFRIDKPKQYVVLLQQLEILLKHARISCGLSMCFRGFQHLQNHAIQADYALKEGIKLNPGKVLYNYKTYIIDHIFSVSKKTISLKDACEYTVDVLERMDELSGSEYCETLYTYLNNERSLVKTAEALAVHRNTLLHRIHKIQELTDIDLDDAELRFRLILSFKIREFLRTNPDPIK